MPDRGVFIHDSADKTPPQPSTPPHRTISGADFARPTRAHLDFPWHVSAALGVLMLILLGLLVWWLSGWAQRNPDAADAIQWGFVALLAALIFGAVVYAFTMGYFALVERYGWALRAHETRTRLGNPAPLTAVIGQGLREVQQFEIAAAAMQVAVAKAAPTPLLSTNSANSETGGDTTIYGAGEDEQTPALPPPGDRLDDYVARGYIRNSRYDLLIGLGDDKPGDVVEWRWSPDGGASEAVICAVAGAPGGGKTTTASQLVGIALHKQIGVVVCDPQRDSGNSQALSSALTPIEQALLTPIAMTDEEIAQAIATVYQIGAAREAGRDASMAPVLLVFDEFSGWLIGNERAKAVVTQLTQIGSRFRKFNVRVLLIGTSWKANLISGELGTTLRSLIRLKVLHGMAAAEASFLTFGMPTEALRSVEKLDTGWAMVYGAGILKQTRVPLIHDLLRDVGQAARRPAIALPRSVADTRSARQRWLDDTRATLEQQPREIRMRAAERFARQGFGQREIAYVCKLSDETAGAIFRSASTGNSGSTAPAAVSARSASEARIDPL